MAGRLDYIQGRVRAGSATSNAACRALGIDGRDEVIQVAELGSSRDADKRAILIGGIHGDEPAGVEALTQFIENGAWRTYPRVQFTIFPCLNPVGYASRTRENGAGMDINRSFRGHGTAESRAVRADLEGLRFDCFYDMHEDVDQTGFYMYEAPGGHDWAPEIIKVVAESGPILLNGSPEPDFPYEVKNGMMQFPGDVEALFEETDEWPLGVYLRSECSPGGLGAESPGKLQKEQRVAMQLAGLNRMLELLSGG